jgi:hypothetical protein
MFNVGKTLGCIMPGFMNISNDIAGFNPPILSLGFIVFFGVSFALGWAVDFGADPAAVGADDVAVLVWLDELSCLASGCVDVAAGVLGTSTAGADTSCGVGVGGGAETLGTPAVGVVIAVAVGLITLAGFTGLTGETGEVTFVGFDIDFTHVFVVVVHGPITGCP